MSAELFLKAVADSTRLKILSSLMEKPKFVEEIAMELNITVSTASFHLKKLQAVGFVVSKKEQYYQTYSLNPHSLDKSLKDIIKENREIHKNAFNKEVLDECFLDGKLLALPVQIKKREVVLGEIAKKFKKNRIYSDKEVHLIIADVFDEFILIKNEMLKYGYLERVENGLRVLKTLSKKSE